MPNVRTVSEWKADVTQWIKQGGTIFEEVGGIMGECNRYQQEAEGA